LQSCPEKADAPSLFCSGVAQGIITGIRGLCNGLGPALYGFIFYMFHVELSELGPELTSDDDALQVTVVSPALAKSWDLEFSFLTCISLLKLTAVSSVFTAS
jgi:hypothetical protein